MTRAHDRQNTLPQRRCTSCTKIPSASCSGGKCTTHTPAEANLLHHLHIRSPCFNALTAQDGRRSVTGVVCALVWGIGLRRLGCVCGRRSGTGSCVSIRQTTNVPPPPPPRTPPSPRRQWRRQQMSVLPSSPGASLADFIFTIHVVFQDWGSPPSEDELYGEDKMRQLRAIGTKEAWVGTLSAANMGNRPDSEAPCFGLLQLDDAVCTVSVYVTTPPNGADDSSARTLTLYHEGGIEGRDRDCSDLFEYCAEQELPYAWHGVVGENLLDDGRQLGASRFCIAPRIYTGCTALGLSYEGDDWDDQLYEEECVRYLRGEPWRRPLNPLSASLIRE